jgi:hypothetical protein
VAWARRREQFGPTGCSAAAVDRLRDAARARLARQGHPNAKKTHCPRGHKYTAANIYRSAQNRGRQCRACVTLRDHRRKHQKLVAAHVRRLRVAMFAAHPDRGGTSAKFIQARRRYLEAARAA